MERSNKERLIVLFLPKWYPCKNRPLNGTFIQKHGEAVAQFCKVNVVFTVADPTLTKGWFEYNEAVESNLNVVRVYYRKKITGIALVDKLVKFFLFLIALFKGYKISKTKFGKPDLVHVHVLFRPAILALYLKIFLGIKYVISEHWTGYLPIHGAFDKFGTLKKWFWRLAVSKSEAVLPDSTDLGYWMQKKGLINSYETIHNVVNTSIFQPGIDGESNKSKVRFIHISSLKDVHKNVSGIINVVKQIYSIRQDFEFYIIGNAFDYEKLKDKSAQYGLLDKVVFFKGRKTGIELAQLLSFGDFFVLFSNYENQPCVIGESFACGVPVVATSVGDIPSIVKNEFGRIVSPGDEKALYNEILYMLDNFKSYNKDSLRKYAVDNFSNDKIGYRLSVIYDEVLVKG